MISGRKLLTFVIVSAMVLMLQLAVIAADKPAGNVLRLDCAGQIDIPQKDTVVGVTAFLSSEQNVGGFSLGFQYTGEGINVKEVTPTENLPKAGQFIVNVDSSNHTVLVGWVDFTGQMPIPKSSDLEVFTINFGVPQGARAQQVTIDSTFIEPAGHWVFSLKDGGSGKPAFINCEGAAITIGKPAATKEN